MRSAGGTKLEDNKLQTSHDFRLILRIVCHSVSNVQNVYEGHILINEVDDRSEL